ncbi:MAG: class I SAM-dependent methyltransferase [Deltaproteobacteria bacterium]|nr:class I SAM-dependent methyltransferase [Deltaproteobacteria bacterium]
MDLISKIFGTDGDIHARYFEALLQTLNVFDKYLSRVSQSKECQEYGCFKYISFNEKKFFAQMHRASIILDILNRKDRARFLDVGCGIGTKVFITSTLFAGADGVEVDRNYIEIAKKIHASSSREFTKNIKFIGGDALKFSYYEDYDVIYLYRPFNDPRRQNELEEKIAREAKENAIIVGTLCKFYNLPEELRPQMVFTNGYLKSSAQQFVERIRLRLADEE